jgi:hypothetical protein
MLAVITCYFNPTNCPFRLRNYNNFRKEIASEKVDLYVIELVFGSQKFEIIPESENLKRIRTQDMMFQKERMLNILLDELPEKYTSVCWMDCDLIFAQNDWSLRIEKALKESKVVQPYYWCAGIPSCEIIRTSGSQVDYIHSSESGNFRRSFSSVHESSSSWINYHAGHVGYVWAARRDFLDKHRFYDVIITGAGDLFMALAYMGHFDFLDYEPSLKSLNKTFTDHFLDWGFSVYEDVHGKVGHTSDLLLHMWHGDIHERNYLLHSECLQNSNFNPNKDLILGDDLCWHWGRENKKLSDPISHIF